jgi:hypothetical protein
VEFGILFNGDMVGMLLGDLGADAIKVESPGGGDYLREMHGHLAPHWSPTHLQVNKNKRSVTINVHRDRGRQVFWWSRHPVHNAAATGASGTQRDGPITEQEVEDWDRALAVNLRGPCWVASTPFRT